MTPETFWSKIDRSAGPNACWPWTGAISDTGYGVFSENSRFFRPHRRAYEFTNGPIPPGLEICHTCDNPPCCNPAHLEALTHAENMAQMADRGRQRDHNLSNDQVAEIRASTEPVRLLAKRYNCNGWTITAIRNGRRNCQET